MFSKIAIVWKQFRCKHDQVVTIKTRTKTYERCLRCKRKRKVDDRKKQ